MQRGHFLTTCLMACALILAVPLPSFAENSNESAVRNIVEAFLKGEFEAKQDLRTSQSGFVKVDRPDKKDVERVLFFENEIVVIVSEYKVSRIDIQAGKARVHVFANALGRSVKKSEGRVYVVPARQHGDQFVLNLHKVGTGWLIVRPTTPRVSAPALVRYLEGGIVDARVGDPKAQHSSAQITQSDYLRQLANAIREISKG